MKKAIYILMSLLWISCANETKSKSESIQYDMSAPSMEEHEISMELKPINYEHLATQKLMDYFDLLRLKQEHPEFEKDISLQLQGYFQNSESLPQYDKIDSIKNIRQNGKLTTVSDSIQAMTLYFDVVSQNSIKTDSILAIIVIKSVLMDSEMVPTTKVSFRNNQLK